MIFIVQEEILRSESLLSTALRTSLIIKHYRFIFFCLFLLCVVIFCLNTTESEKNRFYFFSYQKLREKGQKVKTHSATLPTRPRLTVTGGTPARAT